VIVVGVDGSEASQETLLFALEEARRWQTDLHIVHAFSEWEPIPGTNEMIEQDRGPDEREAWLAALVHRVVGDATDIQIDQSTVENDPAPALLAAARDADLLVLGSRGHGGFAGLLLGSVRLQCAHHASCPVVIVRGRNGRAPDDRSKAD
jgi:nucleotide-binding universal stress UspA family protein